MREITVITHTGKSCKCGDGLFQKMNIFWGGMDGGDFMFCLEGKPFCDNCSPDPSARFPRPEQLIKFFSEKISEVVNG